MANAGNGMDVAYVAQLVRLRLTAEETVLFQNQLDQVVGYMDTLARADVAGIEVGAPPANVLREDIPAPGLDREAVLGNAPLHDGEQFLLPKVVS